MRQPDRAEFAELIGGVYEFYRQDMSKFALDVWWRAMQQYEIESVRDALGRHCMNPDTGQFLPKPADVVKMLGGTTKDAALVAWAKVDQAVRYVGSWATVVFDDPLIHRALEEIGGWVWLCEQSEKEWPFIEKRFCDHYRVYRARGQIPNYSPKLPGRTDLINGIRGLGEVEPTLIGNPESCARVMQTGHAGQSLVHIAQALPQAKLPA